LTGKRKRGIPFFFARNMVDTASDNDRVYNRSFIYLSLEYSIAFLLSTQNLHRIKRCGMRMFLLSCSSAFDFIV